jgi:CRP/FNR family transcriptional regulator, cyclic AMP receptor protein
MRWAILDAVPAEQARAVLAVARRHTVTRGQAVFNEGEHGDCLYLLEQGKIAIRVTTPTGHVATLRVLVAGDVFGELAVISPARRNATAVALEDVAVLTVHGNQMATLRANNPAVDQVLVQALTAEVRRLSRQLLQVMYVPLPQRVAVCLLDLADAYATGAGPVTVPLTQEDIAGLCGTTRPTTNQLLQHLHVDGIIEVSRGRITILDHTALQNLANAVSAP